ncbi:MAG: DUF87 domain-containing protein [Planctomycetes bacterium]|nr:DUF87 domain-containing protein [Planctomycetota bacterium]
MTDTLDHIRELAVKLRPFLGGKADALVSAWIAEDLDGRREIQQLLELHHQRHVVEEDVCALPPPREGDMPREGIEVGQICELGKPAYPFRLSNELINRHLLIGGSSGSGKTTFVFRIAKGLLDAGIPMMIFDFLAEYRPLARLSPKVKVLTVGQTNVSPFTFNPVAELILLCQARSELRDLSPLLQLGDVICKTFYAGFGVRHLLSAALTHAARQWAQHDFADEYTPSFRTLLKWVREYQPAESKSVRYREWLTSCLRCLESLAAGGFGDGLACPRSKHTSAQSLRDETIIFELNLPSDLKVFFAEMLLLCLRQRALDDAKTLGRGVLRNVLICDEGHNLVKKTDEHVESQLAIALRENRGLGTGYIIADQTPSQIDDSAVANCHLQIFFALSNARDLRTANQSLLLDRDDENWLSRLPVGTAIARFGTHRAFVVRAAPMDELKLQRVSDEEIAARNTRFLGDSAKSTPETPPLAQPGLNSAPPPSGKELPEDARQLLVQTLKHPFAGISSLFRGCSISTRKGQAAKENLEQRGLVRSHEIHREIPGGGKTVILEITDKGAEFLRELGLDARYPYYVASPDHEYWKDQAAQHYQRRGFAVTKELPLPLGGSVDVAAAKDGKRVAIEVETGKSDPTGNVQKALAAGFDEVISLATTSPVAQATEQKLETIGAASEKVRVQTVAALQPTADEYLARFFQLTGPEKLLVLDVMDLPVSAWTAREERLARSGVPTTHANEALAACLDSGLLDGDADNLELARATHDAFRVMGALRD